MTFPAIDWGALESPLDPTPQFFVQAPDGRKDWPEIKRQAEFRRLIHMLGPRILVYPIPNAGKRNPWAARKEGILAGVFDMRIEWRAPLTAVIEFKGYDARGRAGQLSDAQIEYGNRMVELGWHAACFFCPVAALDWLRGLGFPVRGAV